DRLRQPQVWDDGPGLAKLVKELPVGGLSPQLTTALGRVLLKAGEDAVPLLSTVQARYPRDFWLNFELGSAWYECGQADEALGFFRAALAIRPDASPAHGGVGVSLLGMGRVDEAIGHCEHALNIDPNFAHAHNNLGCALLAKGRLDEAIGRLGRLDEAIGHFQETIRIDPKGSAAVHINLGNALSEKGRLDEAISQYQESIAGRLNPKASAKAHHYLGQALHRKGRVDEAIGHFEESIRLDPKGAAPAHDSL